jgi:UDP-N-acetylglucosamine acyltransferase
MSAPSIQSQPRRESATEIHVSAVVSPRAEIGSDCFIGPYVIIGDEVTLGDGVRIDAHCVIDGRTRIGDDTHVFPFVSIGLPPQDLKFSGEVSETEIGKRNRIREFVTIHRGTKGGGGLTKTGDDCFMMAQTHIAHDCILGNDVIMANAATLAGHVIVQDGANIGAYSGVHQFCRVGREAYVGGYSVVVKDALPFALTVGNHAKCYGLNKVGVRRRGYSRETISALHHAFHLLLSSKLNTTQSIERIREEIQNTPEVDELVRFVESSQRGVVK